MINCKVIAKYVLLNFVCLFRTGVTESYKFEDQESLVGIKIKYECKFTLNKQTSYVSGSRHHPTEIVKFE